eukprot:748501-Hanusia_phi.AAC.1
MSTLCTPYPPPPVGSGTPTPLNDSVYPPFAQYSKPNDYSRPGISTHPLRGRSTQGWVVGYLKT